MGIEQRQSTPAFAISGDTTGTLEHGLATAAESGAVFVFAKPIELYELTALIGELLGRE